MVKLYNHQSEALSVTADKNRVAVKGFEGLYEVDKLGNVYSLRNTNTLKLQAHNGKRPYYYVCLCKGGKKKNFFIHRLVAQAFIPNPDNLPQVNHIDGDIHNNSKENLEWVTNARNTKHAYENHLRKSRVLWVFDGKEFVTLRSVCMLLGLNYKKVHWRLKYLNWEIDRALDFKGGGQYVMCETLPTSTNSFRSN